MDPDWRATVAQDVLVKTTTVAMKAVTDPCPCDWCQRRIHYGIKCCVSGCPIEGHRWQHKTTEDNLCNEEYNKLADEVRAKYALKDQQQISPEGLASWEAITAQGKNQATWDEARKALHLDDEQARWVTNLKQGLWHWSQPVAYGFVYGMYFCSLDEMQRLLAVVVAVRELLYWVKTVIAYWLCPGFLLLELGNPFSWQEEGASDLGLTVPGRCSAIKLCARRGLLWLFPLSVDWDALFHWVLYIFAPHYYVTFCLVRRLQTGDDNVRAQLLMLLIRFSGFFMFVADCCGCLALYQLMQQHDAPGALGFGYWLTVCGFVVGTGSAWLSLVQAVLLQDASKSLLGQSFARTYGKKAANVMVFLYVPIVGVPLAYGLYVMIYAPLRMLPEAVTSTLGIIVVAAIVLFFLWIVIKVVNTAIAKCWLACGGS